MGIKLSLATINVKDIERSIEFYRDALGLEVSEQFEMEGMKMAMLGDAEQARVELVQAAELPDGPLGVGTRIGFVTDDIAPIREALGDALIALDVPNPMFNFFAATDPDGYAIELMETAGQ